MCLLTVALWAGVLADPAGSPPAWSATPGQSLSLHEELTWALAERSVQFRTAAASRSENGPLPAPPVVWPAAGALTGWFGERRGSHRHPGVDVDGDTGDAVVAAAAGTVTHAGPAPAGFSG